MPSNLLHRVELSPYAFDNIASDSRKYVSRIPGLAFQSRTVRTSSSDFINRIMTSSQKWGDMDWDYLLSSLSLSSMVARSVSRVLQTRAQLSFSLFPLHEDGVVHRWQPSA